MIYEIPIDAIPQNVAVYRFVDDDFVFVDFNRQAEKTENIQKADLITRKLIDIFPEVKAFGLYDVLLRVFKSGQTETFETAFYHDARTQGWRKNTVIKLPNADIMAIYEDLTEIKQLENDREQHRQQLEASQKIAKLGSWTWDLKTNQVLLSAELYRILDIPETRQALNFETFIGFLQIDAQSKLPQLIQEAIKGHQPYFTKHHLKSAQGQKTLICSGKTRYLEGEPTMLFGTVQDITEQQNTLDQLNSMGLIVDNIMNEVFIFDVDTLKFRYLNQAALKNIGYSWPEISQMTPVDIKPDFTYQQFRKLLEPLVAGKSSHLVFETVHCRKDGTLYDVEIRLQLIDLENVKQFVVIANDISALKERRQQLKEAEEKFQYIAKNAFMGVFIYRDTFLYVNQAFTTILGYSEAELLNLSPWEIVAPEDQALLKENARRRLRGEFFSHQYHDIKVLTKTGEIKFVRLSTETMLYQNQYVGMGTAIDITDITKTKEQLNMLAQVTQQADDLIKIVDADGIILFVNHTMVKHSGFSEEELVGAHTRILKSDKHSTEFYRHLWKTITSGKIYKDVFINKKKNGELFYEEETITPIFNEEQNIEYFVSTGKDITSRIELENALRASELNFRNIFEHASDGIVIHTLDGTLLEVNKVQAERLGYSLDELIGQNLTLIDCPISKEKIPERQKEIQTTGKTMFEVAHRTKDGRIIPVEVHATLIEYHEAPAVLSIVRDITERKKSERALIEAEERYHTIYNLSPIGILLIDPETTQAIEFNETAHKQLGYTHLEFEKLVIADYEAVETPNEIQQYIQTNKRRSKPTFFQTKHRTKKGQIRDVMVSAQQIAMQGSNFLFCLYQDITELKRYEAELKTLSLRLTLATKAAQIGVWEWDVTNNTLIWDQNMFEIYDLDPLTPSAKLHELWHASLDSIDRIHVEKQIAKSLETLTDLETQYKIQTPSGQYKYIQATASVISDSEGKAIKLIGVNWDISHQKNYETLLEDYAYRDSLTQIANRRQFDISYDNEWRRAMRNKTLLSICMIDIDYFKLFNDTQGHAAGDSCLKQVAQTIQASASRAGEMAARYGGEEFILLLPNTDAHDLLKISEALRQAVASLKIPHPSSAVLPYVTISVGCATLDFKNSVHDKPEILLKHADDAMYRAKEKGRNRVEIY